MMSSLGLQALAAISVPKWVPPLVLQLLMSKNTFTPPFLPLVDGVEQVHEDGIMPESVSGILLVLLGRKCVYLYFYGVIALFASEKKPMQMLMYTIKCERLVLLIDFTPL